MAGGALIKVVGEETRAGKGADLRAPALSQAYAGIRAGVNAAGEARQRAPDKAAGPLDHNIFAPGKARVII